MEKYLNFLLLFALVLLLMATTLLITSLFFDWPKVLGGGC